MLPTIGIVGGLVKALRIRVLWRTIKLLGFLDRKVSLGLIFMQCTISVISRRSNLHNSDSTLWCSSVDSAEKGLGKRFNWFELDRLWYKGWKVQKKFIGCGPWTVIKKLLGLFRQRRRKRWFTVPSLLFKFTKTKFQILIISTLNWKERLHAYLYRLQKS